MTDDLRNRVRDAAAAGEILSVVYHRGSQPGTIREIAPLDVGADEVRARDVASGIEKTFKLAHLELAGADTNLPAYDPTTPSEDIGTLGVALELHIAELCGLGWHVESADTSISVHRSFKNGKVRGSNRRCARSWSNITIGHAITLMRFALLMLMSWLTVER